MASFYIASRLENAKTVKRIAELLKTWGHRHTYDWTTHGSVYREHASHEENAHACRIVSQAELGGVIAADIVIVLTPGGRGTHVELGAALALGKRVVVAGLDRDLLGADGRPCAFYHHPLVTHVPMLDGLILNEFL